MFQTLLNLTSFYFWLATMGGLFLIGYWVWKKRETVFSKIGVGPSVLQQFSRDLNQQAAEGKLDPVVGREEEIERVIQVLCRRNKNNPVLVGKAGVGKTAIAEGLAQAIVAKKVPAILQNKRVLALDLPAIVAGTKYRGEFEQRLKRITDEIIAARRNVILF